MEGVKKKKEKKDKKTNKHLGMKFVILIKRAQESLKEDMIYK